MNTTQTLIAVNFHDEHSLSRHAKWVWAILLTITAVIGVVVAMNVYIDPYNVLGTQHVTASSTANDRYNKIEHLLENPDKYNTLIIGSSRMGQFNPTTIDTLVPGFHTYNLSFFSGSPREYLKILPFLKKKGVSIESLLVGIDLYPYIKPEESNTPSFWMHPEVNHSSKPVFMLKYLLLPSFFHSFNAFQSHISGQQDIVLHYSTSGTYELKDKGYDYTDSQKHKNEYVLIEQRLDELRQLSEYLAAEGVDTRWFIHPFSQEQKDSLSDATLTNFVARIRAITGDVPLYFEDAHITDKPSNYYDKMHYKPEIAEQIMKDIYRK